MDQHTLTTVLTGLGVLVAMAGYRRAEKKDLASQTDQLERRLGARIDGVDSKVEGLRTDLSAKVEGLRTDLSAKVEGLRTDLSGKIDDVRTDLSGKVDDVRTDLSGKIDDVRTDLGKRIDTLEARMDAGFAETRAEHRSDMRDVRQYLHSLEERFYRFLAPVSPSRTGSEDA